MKRGLIAMGLALTIAALAGCQSSSNSSSSSPPPAPPTVSMTVSGSPTTLKAGIKIGAVDIANSALGCGGTYSAPTHIGTSAAITVAGTPTTMTVTPSNAGTSYLESYYLDEDASGTLTNGDMVWGTSPTGIAGVCFSPSSITRANPDSFNWDTEASGSGGSVAWAGGTQTFSAEPGVLEPSSAQMALIEFRVIQNVGSGFSK